ncbi:endoplasmic reticulum resident protein 44-like isoform X2 [Physella acuta]|uniref:endoplasmic reticulum resident protein 44-like isoform X2 n=1 Tax=Physella acuta TaxID=109671 RepID=UPI0027DCC3F2|nr:endoplasmic reticulum resident protein 44-like isoform X2 [Physella acuta]
MHKVSLLGETLVLVVVLSVAYGEVISLNDQNIDNVLGSSDIAIVNFYADWCRFSQILAPTFEEAGKKIQEESTVPGRIVFAKVDCDRETNIATKYRINKYPTLKLFRGGNIVKKEYRGQRSVEAMVQFAQEQAKDPVIEVEQLSNLEDIDTKKRHIIGYFESKISDNYRVFARVANVLRDDCQFHAALGPVSMSERTSGDHISARPSNTKDDVPYTGPLNSYDVLYQWVTEKCTPLVREITFENAEELTEEGLPFLILFHHPDDTATVESFNKVVAEQVMHEKVNINFLVADGLKFAHPLHHLGKSTDDLPILAIDSFRHMYLFPHDVRKDLSTPGLLKQFIEDLHSGKLHREFHHGPDPTTQAAVVIQADDDTKNIPRDTSDEPREPAPQKITSPPESTFKKLAPSRNRYTILRDEL